MSYQQFREVISPPQPLSYKQYQLYLYKILSKEIRPPQVNLFNFNKSSMKTAILVILILILLYLYIKSTIINLRRTIQMTGQMILVVVIVFVVFVLLLYLWF